MLETLVVWTFLDCQCVCFAWPCVAQVYDCIAMDCDWWFWWSYNIVLVITCSYFECSSCDGLSLVEFGLCCSMLSLNRLVRVIFGSAVDSVVLSCIILEQVLGMWLQFGLPSSLDRGRAWNVFVELESSRSLFCFVEYYVSATQFNSWRLIAWVISYYSAWIIWLVIDVWPVMAA